LRLDVMRPAAPHELDRRHRDRHEQKRAHGRAREEAEKGMFLEVGHSLLYSPDARSSLFRGSHQGCAGYEVHDGWYKS